VRLRGRDPHLGARGADEACQTALVGLELGRSSGGRLLEVDARAECAIAGPGQDRHPDVRVVLHLGDRCGHSARERTVNGVARLGPVQREQGYVALDDLDKQNVGGVAHLVTTRMTRCYKIESPESIISLII
jgi:hypothetical protein